MTALSRTTEQGVPASTARGWRAKSPTEVVSLELFDLNTAGLQREIVRLRRRVRQLTSLVRFALVVLQGTDKKRLVKAIQGTRTHVALRTVLRAIGLSRARFHEWSCEDQCGLDDRSSCPKTLPHQLTRDEVRVIRELVTSQEYRHIPTGCLARLAQRLGKVFASSATWYRLIRLHKWRRAS